MWAPALALMVVGVLAILVGRPPAPTDTVSTDAGVPPIALRMFCNRPARPPVELAPHITCPPGATLSFVARFAAPPAKAVLEVLGGGQPERMELVVNAAPGAEHKLPHQVRLELPGTREVVLTAGNRVLRQSVRVEPDR